MVLEFVRDHERHLGLVGPLVTVVARHGDEPVVELGHEGEPVVVVDVGEPLDLGRGEGRVVGEEAEIAGTLGQVVVEVDEPLPVVGA